MLDGRALVDAQVHAARPPTLRAAAPAWAADVGEESVFGQVYDSSGTIDPPRFNAYMAEQGVDVALVLAEYSPKVSGIQPVEDLLALTDLFGRRFRMIGNINPHLHYPVDEELERQIALGAVALKVHPVHGGFAANDLALYPA